MRMRMRMRMIMVMMIIIVMIMMITSSTESFPGGSVKGLGRQHDDQTL